MFQFQQLSIGERKILVEIYVLAVTKITGPAFLTGKKIAMAEPLNIFFI